MKLLGGVFVSLVSPLLISILFHQQQMSQSRRKNWSQLFHLLPRIPRKKEINRFIFLIYIIYMYYCTQHYRASAVTFECGKHTDMYFSLYLGDLVQCYSYQHIMGWKILKKEELRIAILKFAL